MGVIHANEAHGGGVKDANLAVHAAKGNEVQVCGVVDAVNGGDLSLLFRIRLKGLQCLRPETGFLPLIIFLLGPFVLFPDLLRALLFASYFLRRRLVVKGHLRVSNASLAVE